MYEVMFYGWRGMGHEVKAAKAVTYANGPMTRRQAKHAARRCYDLLATGINPSLVIDSASHRDGHHHMAVTTKCGDLVGECGVMVRRVES